MSISRRLVWRLVGLAGMITMAGFSAHRDSVDSSGTPVPPPPCTTGGLSTDCMGTLKTLGKNWSGSPSNPTLDDTTVKRLYDVVEAFPSGSSVKVQRKSKNGKKIWVVLESIADAQLVFATSIGHPVVVAKMTLDGKSDDDEDSAYGVDKHWEFYVVVSPDADDGSVDSMSRWDVIGIKKPFIGKPKAKIVKSGIKYRACMSGGQYDDNKTYPFAFFSSCPAAHMAPLSALIAAQGAWLVPDASRSRVRDSLLKHYGTELKSAIDGTDPIWITCGLGCCTVTDDM